MEQSYKEILIQKFERFELEERKERKSQLKIEVQNILRRVKILDSEDYYIWGLIYYNSDDNIEYHTNIALEKFMEAYKLDSRNFLSCLYIAHCYHDKGELEKALKFYELVNQNDLRNFQTWRYVKLIELVGYCHFKLGRKRIGIQKFEEVLGWYKKLPLEDLAMPIELIDCLSESNQITKEIRQIIDS